MALDSRHPKYSHWLPAWIKLRDAYEGEDAIKEKAAEYLPPTPSQLLDGLGRKDGKAEIGLQNYTNYIARAQYPSYVEDAVRTMVGVMHNKPPNIELPAVLEPLRQRATVDGESLPLLLRRINAEQLTVGRIGLLADAPTDGNAPLPYLAVYYAETIINWDDGAPGQVPQSLNLVVLNETVPRRMTDFQWENVKAYRVLMLGAGDPALNEGRAVYLQGLFVDTTQFNETAMFAPSIRGRAFDQIPFTFINHCDMVPDPAKPPLLSLANVCLGIYRGEADYRFNLFMQAQDTLVIIGEEAKPEEDEGQPTRVGAGFKIDLPPGGDAKYIGVTDAGLSEQRQALENDHKRAKELAGQMVDTSSRQKESGEALKIRVAAETATLKDIALTGAEGLQTSLRQIATWIGADPEKVIVTPNLDFAEAKMTPTDFFTLMQAKEKGLPISDETSHALMVKHDISVRTFQEEQVDVEKEREARIAAAQAMKPPPPQRPPQAA